MLEIRRTNNQNYKMIRNLYRRKRLGLLPSRRGTLSLGPVVIMYRVRRGRFSRTRKSRFENYHATTLAICIHNRKAARDTK